MKPPRRLYRVSWTWITPNRDHWPAVRHYRDLRSVARQLRNLRRVSIGEVVGTEVWAGECTWRPLGATRRGEDPNHGN